MLALCLAFAAGASALVALPTPMHVPISSRFAAGFQLFAGYGMVRRGPNHDIVQERAVWAGGMLSRSGSCVKLPKRKRSAHSCCGAVEGGGGRWRLSVKVPPDAAGEAQSLDGTQDEMGFHHGFLQ